LVEKRVSIKKSEGPSHCGKDISLKTASIYISKPNHITHLMNLKESYKGEGGNIGQDSKFVHPHEKLSTPTKTWEKKKGGGKVNRLTKRGNKREETRR